MSGLVLGAGGCELFGPAMVQVDVYASHHGARIDGLIPDYGPDGAPRHFVNDQGWTIDILDAYVVITSAALVGCDGTTRTVDMVFGPAPEHMLFTDRDVVNVGSVEVPEGDYCKLLVEYGPYLAEEAAKSADPFPVATAVDLEGVSVLLSGVASKEMTNVNFTFTATESRAVEVDLQLPGEGPTTFAITEDLSDARVTVAKTYDAFFRGVDFAAYDPAAVSGQLLTILAVETSAYQGTTIY